MISAAVIAMLALMIAFSGVALASHPVPPTDETENLDITTSVICTGSVVESQKLNLEIDSSDLINNTPLSDGEKYGKIGYDEKMIGSNGTTDFDKCFIVDTNTTPNLQVHKQIGYTQGELGSLSYDEQLGMKVIAKGKPSSTKSKTECPPYNNTERKLEEWKWCICPFTKWDTTTTTTPAVPGSCEEVNTYSKIVATDVQAETNTEVGITGTSGEPVNLKYKITAKGTGFVVAGVGVYVDDGRGYSALGSRMEYKEKTIGYGKDVDFTKDIGYKSVYSP
ncbi:MAG: hypothetical protein N2V75_05660 [Methanophagales archaeon]|nr:hypothetical protein [Methanophagales archaeon]